MTPEELAAIQARAQAATPGPWAWYGSVNRATRKSGSGVYLATVHGGRRYVMDFRRFGFGGAQPRFQDYRGRYGIMRPAAELVEFERIYRDDICGIDNPDAAFIAHARQDMDTLLAEVTRLQSEVEALRNAQGVAQ